ncbi:hypothetical protein [Neobacillus sp. 19]
MSRIRLPEIDQLKIYDKLYNVFIGLYPSLKSFFAISAGQGSKGGESVEK